jgi:hypothetical protein
MNRSLYHVGWTRTEREGTMQNRTAPDRQAMFIRGLLALTAALLLVVGWYRWAT